MRVLWYTGIIPVVFYCFGVFVVIPGRGLEKNLEAPRKLLENGKHVFIFPEGSMNVSKDMQLQPFKIGAATLASLTSKPVMPISYKVIRESGKRKKILVTLGEVMNFAEGSTPESINSQLEERVRGMLE
jgi:1-acyl-sn-glycerol-3-phosphate acyltransferase